MVRQNIEAIQRILIPNVPNVTCITFMLHLCRDENYRKTKYRRHPKTHDSKLS